VKSLLLASGFGTRLYPLNTNKSKVFIEYRGAPLINHIVNMIPLDIPILVNSNKKFEADFRTWQKTLDRNITLCVEPVFTANEALGAIGSIQYWIETENISEDLLVIAADNYLGFNLKQFIARYNGQNTIVAVHDIGDTSKASQYGVVQLDGHKVVGLEEKPAHPKCSLVSTACYLFPQRVFPLLAEYCAQGKKDNLGGFIAYLIAKDEVHSFVFKEPWFDVGSIEIYQSLQKTKTTRD
jgi:glucose-1-phosphate thymidylyltransferase